MSLKVEDVLKGLAKHRQRRKFIHKTKYGREMSEQYGYDFKAHAEHYQRIKDQPYSMRVWEL